MCVAHGEGSYAADAATIERLEGEGLVAFRYCDAEARLTPLELQRLHQCDRGISRRN